MQFNYNIKIQLIIYLIFNNIHNLHFKQQVVLNSIELLEIKYIFAIQ